MSKNSPISFDSNLFAGSDKSLDFVVPQAAGFTSSWVTAFYAWDDEARGTALLTKTTASGITVLDDATGTFRVHILAADWTNLPPGNYYYEFWRTDTGSKDALAYGAMIVR